MPVGTLGHVPPAALDRWPWCTCLPDPDQLRLFEPEAELELAWNWPAVETSGCGRNGFWRRRTPAVFGDRRGVGPLVLGPDTNILIWLCDNLELVEEGIGIISGPSITGDWADPPGALRDLMSLWWWRDVRMWTDFDVHLGDARKPIRPDRLRSRKRAIEAFAEDFALRGGSDALLANGVHPEDPVCHLHANAVAAASAPTLPIRWPRGKLDRRIVQSAFDAGCHVFLTEDDDVLRCGESFVERGMAILRPRDLLALLDATGELDVVASPYGPVPDLQSLSTFYSLRAPSDA